MEGVPTGMKPPLRLVEQHFKADWQKNMAARKFWQRFREIPEWIKATMMARGIMAAAALADLEGMRSVPGRTGLLGTSTISTMLGNQRKAAAKLAQLPAPPPSSPPPSAQPNNPATTSVSAPSLSHDAAASQKRRAPAIGSRGKQKKAKVSQE
ncbi:hypothetical protein FPV67DRAFT_1679819 [Lyophyllum atratum]|nr:hypothetical protein FPV67DRAFT_1679819 [Lyophyllum atratum]